MRIRVGPSLRRMIWMWVTLVLVAGRASAGPLVSEARAAYDRVEYPEAIRLLKLALAGEALQPAELESAYYLLGSAQLGAGDALGAAHAFETLVALSPRFKPESDASPKVVDAIRAAQSSGTIEPRIVHDPSRDHSSRGELSIAAELTAAQPLRPAIEYHTDVVGDRVVHATLGCVGLRCSTRVPAGVVSYRLGFLTAEGAFALATPAYGVGVPSRSDGVREEAVSKPLYKKWWLWTVVGVVVVGTVAGATAGVLSTRASHSIDFHVQKTCMSGPCAL